MKKKSAYYIYGRNNYMKKRAHIISIVCIFVLCILLIVWYISTCVGPIISYDPDKLLNYEDEYTQIAELCYQDYLQLSENDNIEYSVYLFNLDKKRLTSYNPEKHTISLTDEKYQALKTIYDNYRLDKHDLDFIGACDNFVSLGIANGRASFIYSVNNEKPNFVNRPDDDYKSIWVEKITDHWYYACVQKYE